MAIKRFLADVANGDMAASSGLTVTPPDRNLETVDPLGEVVGLHEARFDETVSIAAVPSYTEVLGNSNNGLLLASGVDANGTTALLLYLNDSNHSLDVYSGTSAPGYTHLRFRGAPGGGYSGSGEVCEFRWIGGEINDAQALNNTSLLTAFADLGFLEGP